MSPEFVPPSEAAYALWLAARAQVPADLLPQVDRVQRAMGLTSLLEQLAADGWTPEAVAGATVWRREWSSVRDPASVMRHRLGQLAAGAAPAVADPGRRSTGRSACAHGVTGGCHLCPFCRRGRPDPDGVLCSCASLARAT